MFDTLPVLPVRFVRWFIHHYTLPEGNTPSKCLDNAVIGSPSAIEIDAGGHGGIPSCLLVYRQSAGDFTHGDQTGQGVVVLNGFVGNGLHPTEYQGLRLGLVGDQMQIGKQNLVLVKEMILLRLRSFDRSL